MKIQKIIIKEFKVLKDVDMDFNGANILLIGENGIGKSSVMQFIEIALGKNTNIPPNAEGEGEVITSKNGEEYRFHVKMKDGRPTVTVSAPNGLRDNRKSALATIVGAIDFDVNEFVALSDTVPGRRKQVEIYKGLLPPEVVEELNNHEHSIKISFDDRTEINKKIVALKGFVKESKLFGDDLKIQPFDITGIQKQLETANKTNENIRKVKSGLEERDTKIQLLKKENEEIMARMEKIAVEVETLEGQMATGVEWLFNNKEIDTAPLFSQINDSASHNAKYAEAQQILEKQKQITKLEAEAGEFTALIESSKQAIEDAIRDFDSPVKGLTFDTETLSSQLRKVVPVKKSEL